MCKCHCFVFYHSIQCSSKIIHDLGYDGAPLALESQTSINKLEAPWHINKAQNAQKHRKNQFYKDSVRFYKYK